MGVGVWVCVCVSELFLVSTVVVAAVLPPDVNAVGLLFSAGCGFVVVVIVVVRCCSVLNFLWRRKVTSLDTLMAFARIGVIYNLVRISKPSWKGLLLAASLSFGCRRSQTK